MKSLKFLLIMLLFIGGMTGLQASTLDLRQNSKTEFIQVDKFVKVVNQFDITNLNLQKFDTDEGSPIFRSKYQSDLINIKLEQKSLNKKEEANINIQNIPSLFYRSKQSNNISEISILKYNIYTFTDVGIHKV